MLHRSPCHKQNSSGVMEALGSLFILFKTWTKGCRPKGSVGPLGRSIQLRGRLQCPGISGIPSCMDVGCRAPPGANWWNTRKMLQVEFHVPLRIVQMFDLVSSIGTSDHWICIVAIDDMTMIWQLVFPSVLGKLYFSGIDFCGSSSYHPFDAKMSWPKTSKKHWPLYYYWTWTGCNWPLPISRLTWNNSPTSKYVRLQTI